MLDFGRLTIDTGREVAWDRVTTGSKVSFQANAICGLLALIAA